MTECNLDPTSLNSSHSFANGPIHNSVSKNLSDHVDVLIGSPRRDGISAFCTWYTIPNPNQSTSGSESLAEERRSLVPPHR